LIKGNTIGSLDGTRPIVINSSLATVSPAYGIYLTTGNDTLRNNIIGDITLSNTTGVVGFTGIYLGAAAVMDNIVEGNTIAKISALYGAAVAGGNLRGIATAPGAYGMKTITGNTIYDLNTATTYTGSGVNASTIGILLQSTTPGQIIQGNVIHSLTNSAATATVHIVGIQYSGPSTGINQVRGNFIHSLSNATTSLSASVTGINNTVGIADFSNNMIRLG
jgi:hypothetical protein